MRFPWWLGGRWRSGTVEPMETPEPIEPREIDMSNRMWGHSIEFLEKHVTPGVHQISGWCDPRPRVGDHILFPFSSDAGPYLARLQVISIELCSDPTDMFFATVGNIGPRPE